MGSRENQKTTAGQVKCSVINCSVDSTAVYCSVDSAFIQCSVHSAFIPCTCVVYHRLPHHQLCSNRLIKCLDTDHDGKISVDELKVQLQLPY